MHRILLAVFLAAVVAAGSASARDLDGRYAQSQLKPWFDSLKSGNGDLCCSSSDGRVIEDADWDTRGDRYRVRVPGPRPDDPPMWVDVPDDAVIAEPNRAGRTMVWPMYGVIGLTIRCFMPGSMT
jgi:hypothetical protein